MARTQGAGAWHASDEVPVGFDRTGVVLLSASAFVVALLLASTVLVISLGAEWWRTHPNPNPAGVYSRLYLYATTIVLFGGIASVFVLPAYAAWYRATQTGRERSAIGTRWMAVMFVFAALPFYAFGQVLNRVGDLLQIGALVAIIAGGGLYASTLRKLGALTR